MTVQVVTLKHAGKSHQIDFDVQNGSARDFMALVARATAVPEERQKILVKGGMLKTESDMTKVDFSKPLMVMGTAGPLPTGPKTKTVFLEDLTDAQLAEATKTPAGLTNLGQTCYMNSTIQYLRAIPELQDALSSYKTPSASSSASDGSTLITAGLSSLYNDMRKTAESFPPLFFLSALRRVVPQFNERDDHGHPAQQDAEECYGQIVQALQNNLVETAAQGVETKRWVESYMGGEFETKLALADAGSTAEPVLTTREPFRQLDCFISMQTNYMEQGIKAALTTTLEKHSESLGRNATYQKTMKCARLPSYLTVHFVRFFWRADVNAKSKIMRKVKFPFELDLYDICSDSLQAKILEPRKRLQAAEKARSERARSKKRQKMLVESGQDEARPKAAEAEAAVRGDDEKSDADLRAEEARHVDEAMDPDLKKDTGANTTGLYELVAVLTHKGASADGGHYMAFVRKSALAGKPSDGHANGQTSRPADDDDEWYRFNDDKVDTIPSSKIATLDGGGEDSSAYLCLYRTRLP